MSMGDREFGVFKNKKELAKAFEFCLPQAKRPRPDHFSGFKFFRLHPEFDLGGYGIADFVFYDEEKDILIAFELKMKDWKRAFVQAYKYSFYADLSVVVMPEKYAKKARKHIHMFEESGIELWVIDSDETLLFANQNAEYYWGPKSPKSREKAIAKLCKRLVKKSNV